MNLVFLGPPGAGKGTMASKAKEKYNIPHISTGELFRNAITEQTELGKFVKNIIDGGDLVPDKATIEIIKERLTAEDTKMGFILDGYPRTILQAEALLQFSNINSVINFGLNNSEIIKRLSGRRVCKNCGSSFHTTFMPPAVEDICNKCQGDLFTRDDDKIDSIKHRIDVYKRSTQPLIEFFNERKLLFQIDASCAPNEVFETLESLINR